MTEEGSEPRATDTITVLEGFEAMPVFLEVIWQRQDRASQEIAFVLGGSRLVGGSPADPTIWEDWLVAIRMSRAKGGAQYCQRRLNGEPLRIGRAAASI